jgi:peptidoglycan/xylan/chitin deacetylase (PgdA/CDA1 family)
MAPGQLAAASSRPALHLGGVPVLLYHGLTGGAETNISHREKKYWVSVAQFRDQLKQILQGGWQVALLRELWSSSGPLDHEKPCVALTFDDGRAGDHALSLPALLEAGVRADLFVNTNAIGKQGFLSWQQMAEMQRAGMSFQSHSHDHVDLSSLTQRALENQLRRSKWILEDRLGCCVDFLAVPYGLLNGLVVNMALEVGYRAVCNSSNWPSRPGSRIVSRVAVYGHTTLQDFRRLLAGDPLCYARRAARTALLYLPKRLLLRLRPNHLGVRVLGEKA